MNVLGVVVKALPENLGEVRRALEASGLCEVFAEDNEGGRLVVAIEGEDDSEALGRLRQVTALKNVLAADLIHIASESDPEAVQGGIPEALEREEDAKGILYGGSVYNWLAKS